MILTPNCFFIKSALTFKFIGFHEAFFSFKVNSLLKLSATFINKISLKKKKKITQAAYMLYGTYFKQDEIPFKCKVHLMN